MPLFHRKSNSLGTPAVAGPGAGYGNTYGPAYAPAYPTYGSAMGASTFIVRYVAQCVQLLTVLEPSPVFLLWLM